MAKQLDSPDRPKAIGYTRVSTDKQAEKGGSLAVQRDRIVEFAVLSGFELVGIFEDAVSGAKGEDKRPGFRAALDVVRRGEASVFIVADGDRFARDDDERGHARVEIRRAGGKVLVISEQGANVEMIAVRQLLAVLEREKIRARMRTWSATRKAKGLRMGPAPFGSRDGEAAVLQRMRALRAAGSTLAAIAATLNADGIPTPRGSEWKPGSVDVILKRSA